LDDASDDFYDQFQAAKLVYYQNWAAQAKTPQTRYNYACELMRQKRYAQALAEFQKTLEADPEFYEGYYTMGACQESAGRFDLALAHFLTQQKKHPNDERIPLALGRVHYKMENFAAALPLLREATRGKDAFESYLYLSLTLKALGKAEESEAIYQEGLKLGTKPAKAIETSNRN
jgi:tetratricopeptide (TPR) repeat protein